MYFRGRPRVCLRVPLIEPDKGLFAKHNCAAETGVHQIEEGRPFRILVGIFGNQPLQLLLNQTIARVDDHPTNLAESQISNGELLGLTEENTHYKKRDINVKDIETINKHLGKSPTLEFTTVV